MRTVEAQKLQSLHAVQSFLDRHRDRLPGIATGGARRRLDDTLTGLETHAADQAGSALATRGCTQRYRTLRRRLMRTHMTPVARIARAAEPPIPELLSFRMPHGKPTAQKLAAAAYGMSEAARPHAATFTMAGLPDDFAERMVRAAEEMMESLTERSRERTRCRGATTGIRAKLATARRIVRVLDAFVSSVCEDDAVTLAEWDSAKRVWRTGRKASGSSVETVDESPAAATPGRALDQQASNVLVEEVRLPVAFGNRVFALLAGSRNVW